LNASGVKCLAQGHIGVSQWIRTEVSHTKGMCLSHHHQWLKWDLVGGGTLKFCVGATGEKFLTSGQHIEYRSIAITVFVGYLQTCALK